MRKHIKLFELVQLTIDLEKLLLSGPGGFHFIKGLQTLIK